MAVYLQQEEVTQGDSQSWFHQFRFGSAVLCSFQRRKEGGWGAKRKRGGHGQGERATWVAKVGVFVAVTVGVFMAGGKGGCAYSRW